MNQQVEEPEESFQSPHQPNDRSRTVIPNCGTVSWRNSRNRATETDLRPNRSDRAPNPNTRHRVRTNGHLKCFPGGPSDHVAQIQDCRKYSQLLSL